MTTTHTSQIAFEYWTDFAIEQAFPTQTSFLKLNATTQRQLNEDAATESTGDAVIPETCVTLQITVKWIIIICFWQAILWPLKIVILQKKVPFSMAIGNGELMRQCFPKH